MCKLRDVVIFLAGAEFFHTLTHAILPFFVKLPLTISYITFTSSMNTWVIIINAVVTIALLWWASRLHR